MIPCMFPALALSAWEEVRIGNRSTELGYCHADVAINVDGRYPDGTLSSLSRQQRVSTL